MYQLPEDAVLKNLENIREGCDYALDDGGTWPSPGILRDPQPLEKLLSQVGELKDGDVVYVKSDMKDDFFQAVFPSLTSSIVLVTAGEDHSNPDSFRDMLDDPRITKWFGQNCDLESPHPRFSCFPLGFTDTHIPHGDQHALLECHRAMPDIRDKRPVAYASFHLNRSHGERRRARRALLRSACVEFEKRRLSCRDVWMRHRDFAFEICPRGTGVDTHRVYEALLMRTIPIVRSSTLDSLYCELPIIIVSEWEEVTPESLRLWKELLEDSFHEQTFSKLTRDFWVHRVRSAVGG